MDQVKENERALELDIPHLSLYSLILEHHTVFMNKMRQVAQSPNGGLEAEMFDLLSRIGKQ